MTEGQTRLIDFWKGFSENNHPLEVYQHVLFQNIKEAMSYGRKSYYFPMFLLQHVNQLRIWLEEEHGLQTDITKRQVSYDFGWEIVGYNDCLLVYWE